MAIKFRCPSCGKTLQAQDDAIGLTVRCPGCQSTTAVPETSEGEETYGMSAEQEPSRSPAAGGHDDGRRPCPMCGEMIAANAIKCRFCGEIFDETLRRAERKKSPSSKDDSLDTIEILVGLLCAGIGCIISIIWIIQGKPKGTKMLGVSVIGIGIGVVLRLIFAAAAKR
jgi:phage FluMu protein Com